MDLIEGLEMSSGLKHWVKILRGTAASTARGWQGMLVTPAAVKPKKMLKLYEFEACPYCRLVREVLTELHLDAEIYPCPKGGKRFRQEAKAIGGKAQFPFLIDPNTGDELYESSAIIAHLYETYGQRPVPLRHKLRPLQVLSSYGNSVLGGNGGMNVRRSLSVEKMLRLYSFEASPFSRVVREKLCELELPYELINLGKEQAADLGINGMHAALGQYSPVQGGKREQFLIKTNKMMVPYLEDPNAGRSMFESRDIVDYLEKTYAL
jgi:glutathione S-transferase